MCQATGGLLKPVRSRIDEGTYMTRELAEESSDDGKAGERTSAAAGRTRREGLGGATEGGAGGVEDGPEAGLDAESHHTERSASVPPADDGQVDLRYTPLWLAQHEARYLRRQ